MKLLWDTSGDKVKTSPPKGTAAGNASTEAEESSKHLGKMDRWGYRRATTVSCRGLKVSKGKAWRLRFCVLEVNFNPGTPSGTLLLNI